jgi:cell wall assembly regulator SMI1
LSATTPENLKKLFTAVKNGDVAAVRVMLDQGVDPNSRNSQDETPIMEAARKANMEVFELLQKAGADLGARNKNGNLTLFRSAMCLHGNEAIAQEMLRRILDAVGIGPDQDRLSDAFVMCSSKRSPDHLRMLVRCGADPNHRSTDGETALLAAVWENRPETVSALLAVGANPNTIVPRGRSLSWLENIPRRYWGRPLIDLALGKRLGPIADILSAAGAKPTIPDAMESVAYYWEQIDAWLQLHAPQWKPLMAGTTAEEIAEAQAALGLTLPTDFQSSYAKHNGSADFFPGVGASNYLMPLSEIAKVWQMLGDRLDANDFQGSEGKADVGIAPVPWHKAWVPFVSNGGGDYFCLDLAPGDNGTAGQIISFNHETGDKWLIAPSIGAWLADLVQELRAGQLRYEAASGLVDARDPCSP